MRQDGEKIYIFCYICRWQITGKCRCCFSAVGVISRLAGCIILIIFQMLHWKIWGCKDTPMVSYAVGELSCSPWRTKGAPQCNLKQCNAMFTCFTESSGLLSGQVGAEFALLSLIRTADDGMRLWHSKGFFFAPACCQSSAFCGFWDLESSLHCSHTVDLQLDTEFFSIKKT